MANLYDLKNSLFRAALEEAGVERPRYGRRPRQSKEVQSA